jgi:hypothetical protein
MMFEKRCPGSAPKDRLSITGVFGGSIFIGRFDEWNDEGLDSIE